MQVDWFTLIAQIVNFLILLFLLKKLLFERVIQAMKKREQNIADQLQNAEMKESEADSLRERLEEEKQAWENKKNERENALRDEIEEKRKTWTAEVRDAVAAKRNDWEEQLKKDQAAFETGLRQEAASCIFSIARHAIHDLAGQSLESAITACFIERLRSMKPQQLERLKASLKQDENNIIAESRFDLSETLQNDLADALNEQTDRSIQLQVEKNESIEGGILLRSGDWVMDWEISHYLDGLGSVWQKQTEALQTGHKEKEEPEKK